MNLVSMAGLFRTTSFVFHLWFVFSNELVTVHIWAYIVRVEVSYRRMRCKKIS